MSLRLAVVVLGGLVAVGTAAFGAFDGLRAEASPAAVEPGSGVTLAIAAPPVAEPVAEPVAAEPVAAGPAAAEPVAPEPAPEAADADDAQEGDGEDEVWVGPPEVVPDCEGKLEAAGIEWKASRIPLHKTRSGIYCGAEQIVRYRKGPGAIRWGGSPQVTCPVALGLARLEAIVQEEAERNFGRKVARIQHMGTYNCREMANYPGWVSEHSYANAIDIKHFELVGGKKIPVLGVYPKHGAEPKNASARFLKAVARRLYDERVFAVVLTPSFDSAHRNHFHLDMARYLVDGT
jgi:hypothetical protein